MTNSEFRVARMFSLSAISLMLIGSYFLLTTGTAQLAALGCIGLGIGFMAAAARLASRRSIRTRYKKQPWATQDFIVFGLGLATLVAATFLRGV
jgi:energy-coupling factor transport system permease protein